MKIFKMNKIILTEDEVKQFIKEAIWNHGSIIVQIDEITINDDGSASVLSEVLGTKHEEVKIRICK